MASATAACQRAIGGSAMRTTTRIGTSLVEANLWVRLEYSVVPIVTATDHRFARTLLQMLASAERRQLPHDHAFWVFDLGMGAGDRTRIARRFPWCRVQGFDFDARPPHVRDLSNFAWKPCLLWDMVRRSDAPVLWFDSATLFHGNLDAMLDGIDRDGIFSLAGQTPLGECCDARTLSRLAPAAEDLRQPYRAGGVLGFDPRRPAVREVVRCWRDCALDPACIAPPDVDRRHRFDQAILTALLCRAQREGDLHVGRDEIDISSTDPVDWVSTRNKVAAWLPMAADLPVRAYYAAWKRADRLGLRCRRDGVVRGAAVSAERTLQRTLARAQARRRASVPVTEKAAFRGRACHCD